MDKPVIDLDNLERLEREATPGEWFHDVATNEVCAGTSDYYVPDLTNAALIASARNALPAMLAVARAAVAWFDALDTKNATLINEAEDDLICTVRVNLKEAP